MKRWAIIAALAVLTACAGQPVVGEMSQDRVIIVGNNAGEPAILAEANRGCGMYGRSAHFMSWRCMDQYCVQKAYLFACPAPTTNTPRVSSN